MRKLIIVDRDTGEIIDDGKSVKYSCFVHTGGIDWTSIVNFNQLKAMHFMAWKMNNDGSIHLVGKKKQELMEYLGVAERQYNRILKQMMGLDLIRRISNGEYMVNPSIVFRGSSNRLNYFIEKYSEQKHQK